MIAGGLGIEQLRLYLQKAQFRTLFDDAEEKEASGMTTKAEITRELGLRQ
jgi:type II secretory ATPase GspE/PulE/Tfp pilus assembly ATPase PilB-like protein